MDSLHEDLHMFLCTVLRTFLIIEQREADMPALFVLYIYFLVSFQNETIFLVTTLQT